MMGYPTPWRSLAIAGLLLVFSCSGDQSTTRLGVASTTDGKARHGLASHGGQITFMVRERGAFRIEGRRDAVALSLTPALDKLSRGTDRFVNVSSDGTVLLLDTTRFGCGDWNCLALVDADLSKGDVIRANEELIHSDGFAAVSAKGRAIAYAVGRETGAGRDLFLVARSEGGFGSPINLTAKSPYPYNWQPAFSPDGGKLLFDCGTQPWGVTESGLCEVSSDGSGLRVVGFPGTGWAKEITAVHQGAYAPDGTLIFEVAHPKIGERIWKWPAGAPSPEPIATEYRNDNSPCVLPDGRVVSLWLGRPGNEGNHEIKVMGLGGEDYFLALKGHDVADVGIGCAAWGNP